MYLVLKREGDAEPTRWRYNPKKLMSVEREDIERRTGRNFAQFTQDVLQGNSLCRRALLFTYLRRDHPKTRFEDVDFAWDELKLEYSKQEFESMRENMLESLHGDELAASLAAIDRHIEDAFDDTETEGKAQLPIAE
ncbi:hypothetical protein [Streptomyces sp. PpalLS-921]|uniref:hypothetical protein n=1 Tax=Streptomyces sp. PpalLS-921 TaxID=1839772 RepID=UPI00081D9243|nr:hypothetical protein [Streptomyces sp. PpalLS-921]SCD61215.1 hypothetical protein GA0115249_106316 [Streptomyces sp. PpalLS-921]